MACRRGLPTASVSALTCDLSSITYRQLLRCVSISKHIDVSTQRRVSASCTKTRRFAGTWQRFSGKTPGEMYDFVQDCGFDGQAAVIGVRVTCEGATAQGEYICRYKESCGLGTRARRF